MWGSRDKPTLILKLLLEPISFSSLKNVKMEVEFVLEMQNIFPKYTMSKPRTRNKKCTMAA